MKRKPSLQVWKFGGASLADAAAVRHAVGLIRAHHGPLVVVASALAGVTDLLLDGAKRSVGGEPEAASQVAATFLRRHRDLAHALVKAPRARHELLLALDAAAREYREIAHAMAALGDLSARASDTLVARGERASSALVAAALQASGRKAERVDAALLARVTKRFEAEGRADDNPDAFRKRLGAYNAQTAPLLPKYKGEGKLNEIDGMASVEAVAAAISRILDGAGKGGKTK
jgi:aspartokinase